MREDMFYNAAAMAHGSNYRKLSKLLEKFGSWETVWNQITAEEKREINPEKEWARLKELGIRFIARSCGDFPSLLKEIPWTPFGIYIKGVLPKKEFSVAVVGTRKATAEGKECAKKFSRELSLKNFVIISGLALGIDAAAHMGCIDAKGETVAVLANGLDSVYPVHHAALAKKILEYNGALISEYPPGTPPFPSQFLERNRIVSGLARGTLVIEAPDRSGSLVTARFAIEQNRDVFVIPGPISSSSFSGSNQLIRRGALLVTKTEEILEAFGIEPETPRDRASELETDEERVIFGVLRELSRATDADTIIELTKLGAADANKALSFLIIKNIVKETEGGYTLIN